MLSNLSIRNKLLVSFLLFTAVAFLIMLSSFWYLRVQHSLFGVTSELDEIKGRILEMKQVKDQFIAQDILNSSIHTLGNSESLNKHLRYYISIKSQLNRMRDDGKFDLSTTPDPTTQKQVKQVKRSLDLYMAQFDELIQVIMKKRAIEERIAGDIKDQLKTELEQINSGIDNLRTYTLSENEYWTTRLEWMYMLFVLLFLGVSILLSFYLSGKIVHPVLLLKNKFSSFTTSGFKHHINLLEGHHNDEVGELIDDFNLMAESLNEHVVELNRRNKELTTSNQQLAGFTSIVSHDLKSPLRTMNSFVSLLKRRMKDKLGESEQEYMDFIQDGAKKMTELVNDLHEYSTIQSKGLTVERVPFEPMFNDVLRLVDYQLRATNTEISVKSKLSVINCDLIKIRQVFQNLISNSMKYVAEGVRPEIIITCVELAKHWQFSIRDNGIGIPEESVNQVFQPFNRAGLGQEFEGTGLGLSICKKIIENHGGEIWVEGNPAGGSTFHFTISRSLALTKQAVNQVARTL